MSNVVHNNRKENLSPTAIDDYKLGTCQAFNPQKYTEEAGTSGPFIFRTHLLITLSAIDSGSCVGRVRPEGY